MDSPEDDDETQNKIRTSVEVDEAVWRELRATAVRNDRKVSEELEAVLREHFDLTDTTTTTNDN